jgi:nucleoid DNA-binding protein
LNTKSLVKKVNSKSSVNRDEGALIFDRIFGIIKESVIKDKIFTVENFGKFVVEHREMHKEIDYKSRSEVLVPPKDKIKFIPLFLLRRRT